jgi:hypothetical protein
MQPDDRARLAVRGAGVIIDFLISKEGLRVAKVDISMSGIRLAHGPSGFVPRTADELTGAVHLSLHDLSNVLARPEIVDQFLGGVSGLARPDISLFNGEEEGSIRIVGSIETMGRRIPIKASTRVSVTGNKLVLAATHLEGLPIIGTVPVQLFDIVLPLSMPPGLNFTGVTTAPGHVVIAFSGTDIVIGDEVTRG